MALALTHPAVLELTPPQLAAYVGALLCSEVIKRPISVWSAYKVRAGAVGPCISLCPVRRLTDTPT